MKSINAIISVAAFFGIATAAQAGEVSDIKAQSEQLREQNQALTRRIADLEKRQHRLEAQPAKQRVLAALGIDAEEARRKFGFLLEAFEYGVPPNGGWAGGLDRMVMEGLGTDNIRDVIAFPKNQQGQEPMTDAPAPVDPAQLRELGIGILPATPQP